MPLTALVSYDDSPSDRDALMLARILGSAAVRPVLVYVRHAPAAGAAQEQHEALAARHLLERGAHWLGRGDDASATRIVFSASTAEGLRRIAAEAPAELIIFGSEHRTPPGQVTAQRSTQTLLDGGPAAVAIAPAGYRSDRVPRIRTIGVIEEDGGGDGGDDAVRATASDLATHFGAEVSAHPRGVDLLIVGSRKEAPRGQVIVSARTRNLIDGASAPVLVLARGVPLRFAVPAAA